MMSSADLAVAFQGRLTPGNHCYWQPSFIDHWSRHALAAALLPCRQAEEAMRRLIRDTFPSHGVFGEEHGLELGSSSSTADSWLWVLDPIDGTKSFITGQDSLCMVLYCCNAVLLVWQLPVLLIALSHSSVSRSSSSS
jgi:hypothetical protein